MSGKTTAAAIIFKVFLPCVLLAAAIVRYNGLSGVYLLCLMALPLMPNPTKISMAGRTGNYMKILIVLACLACTSQLLFQVVLLSEGLFLYGSQLQPCNGTENLWRQLGFQRLDNLPISTLCRLIVPDIMVCITAIVVYIICRILILRQNDVITTERSISRTTKRKHLHQTTIIIQGVQNAMTVCLCAVAGVILPSAISAVYFLSFLIIITWWSLYKSWGSKFNLWMLGWLMYSGTHVILLYLYQFQFFQEILPPEADIVDSSQDFLTRLLGLTAIVTTDCAEPRSINVVKDQHWPVYVNPLVLLIFYLYTAWQVRIWMDGDRNEQTTKRRRRHSTDNRENGNQSTSYEALPSVQIDLASSHSQLRQRRVKKQPSTNVASEDKPATKTSKFGTIMAYVTKQCFIGALVVMMAWSITYHSWLTFVLLLWACAIWILPVGTTRKRALYTSPILVFYAECLLCLQFVYGLNLTSEELPTQKGHLNLKELGLVKYMYPCIPLGVQLLFTGMFWLTLRQFWREQCLAQICPKSKGIILQPVEMIFSGPNEEIPALKAKMKQSSDNLIDRAHSQAMSALGNMIWELFSKYWILLCGAMLLIVSLESNVDIFKIIYMGLFLLIINIFLLNFTVFRFISKPFAWVVVLYSVCTLVLIYTYQFENFPDMWTNGTGISMETLEYLGLQQYGTQDLFINLLIPTAFIIIFMVQLHYFHDRFLKMSEIRKSGYSLGKLTEDESDGAGRSRLVTRQASTCPSANGERKRWTKARIKEETKDLMHTASQQTMNGTRVIWRLLEIHMVKFVICTVVIVVVHEVTAINYVFVLLIFLAIPFPRMYRIASMLIMMWLSVVFLVKMICQLEVLSADDWMTGCNYTDMKVSSLPPC
ncbi:piezo-type mechanosensitive ion channel component 2-like [Amphiura filiformis]|uniref:piezo-type mechanosensitive ion channel component 2-like n=1 Tax=Amphiura filiformis TaxID=82378 RepID=UPI003B213B7E